MGELLAGRINEAGYAAYLLRLRVVYDALESVGRAHRNDPLVGAVHDQDLERLAALDADLDHWAPGGDRAGRLPRRRGVRRAASSAQPPSGAGSTSPTTTPATSATSPAARPSAGSSTASSTSAAAASPSTPSRRSRSPSPTRTPTAPASTPSAPPPRRRPASSPRSRPPSGSTAPSSPSSASSSDFPPRARHRLTRPFLQGRMDAGHVADTPTQHVVPKSRPATTYGGRRSWFAAPARRGEATGNPVRVRDCPAAVSGNDRRQTALDRHREPGKRRPVGVERAVLPACPRVRRPASAPRPSGAVVRGLVGRPTAGYDAAPTPRRTTVSSCATSDRPGPISRGERHDGHRQHRPHDHAGAQAERRRRARRRQQDRARRRPGLRRPGRRRPDAGRDPHHQRALRRRHHRRARPAVDPDGRRDDRRGAAVLPARRPAAGRLHRQGGPQPGRRVVQPVGRARPRRGADRRRDGAVRQGQRPQARLRRSTATPTAGSSTSGCAPSTTATCCGTRPAGWSSRRRSTSCCGSRAGSPGRRPRRSSSTG